MSAEKKLEILRSVEGSGLPVADALTKLLISPSTYYRWQTVPHGRSGIPS
jgi:hypothetical protein